MSPIRLLALWLVCSAAFAQAYEDGIYELSDQETGKAVYAADGTQYWLGEPLDVALDVRSVFACDNSNERFGVTLRYPSPALTEVTIQKLLSGEISFPNLALVIDGSPYISRGSGGGDGEATVSFDVSGAASAERVAEYLGTEVGYRHHPGHRLLVRFLPQQQMVQLNDDVPIALEITNVGSAAVSFNLGARLPFQFFATRSGESVQTTTLAIREESSTSASLQPSETRRIEANVAAWLKFDRPGTYRVFGAYFMQFQEPQMPYGQLAIWSEYVSGDFTVTVEP